MRRKLLFEEMDDGASYDVYYKRNKEYLGWCMYDKDWKCWVFIPTSQDCDQIYYPLQFSASCMEEILDFLKLKEKENLNE